MTTLRKLKKEYALNLISSKDLNEQLVDMLDLYNYTCWYEGAVNYDGNAQVKLDKIDEITQDLISMIDKALSHAEHACRRYVNHTTLSGKHIVEYVLEELNNMKCPILARIRKAREEAIKNILFEKHIEETCGWDVLSPEEQVEKRQKWMNS